MNFLLAVGYHRELQIRLHHVRRRASLDCRRNVKCGPGEVWRVRQERLDLDIAATLGGALCERVEACRHEVV